MAKISILPSSRVTYDPDNQAIRSYFEPRLHDETNDAPTEDVTDEFIHNNQDLMGFICIWSNSVDVDRTLIYAIYYRYIVSV